MGVLLPQLLMNTPLISQNLAAIHKMTPSSDGVDINAVPCETTFATGCLLKSRWIRPCLLVGPGKRELEHDRQNADYSKHTIYGRE